MAGFSQREVAEAMGLESASCISRWEKGEVIPEPENIFKLAYLYSTLAEQLFGDLWTGTTADLKDKKLAMMDKKIEDR